MIGGVHLKGDAAQILAFGRKVGNLYRWSLEGIDGNWKGYAQKYRLDEPVDEVELRFFLAPEGVLDFEMQGTGFFMSALITDGTVHRETVRMKGTRLWLQTPVPA